MGINRVDKFGIYSVFLICLQFPNCLAPSKNSHFAGRSRYSYFAPDDSGIAPVQSRNLDKVRIPIIVHVYVISFSYDSKPHFCKFLSHLKI